MALFKLKIFNNKFQFYILHILPFKLTELISLDTFRVSGSCHISTKANLGKTITTVCSFNKPTRISNTNAAVNSKNTFSKCFSPTRLINSIFKMFT
uniref:Uncharacterized protein n=2 Tax=Sus scrofa TaxID=9823 RepID=A0A8D0W1N4_PIG